MSNPCVCGCLAGILPAHQSEFPDHVCLDTARASCGNWLRDNWPCLGEDGDDQVGDECNWVMFRIAPGLSIHGESLEDYPLRLAPHQGWVQLVIRQWAEEQEEKLADALGARPEWSGAEATIESLAELGLPATPSTLHYRQTGSGAPSRGLLVTTFCVAPVIYGPPAAEPPDRPYRTRPETCVRVDGSSSYATSGVWTSAARTATRHAAWWREIHPRLWRWDDIGNLRKLNRGTRGGDFQRSLAERVARGEMDSGRAYQQLRARHEEDLGRALTEREVSRLRVRLEAQI